MKKTSIFLFVLVVILGLSFQANAELIVRGTDSLGRQLIYDTDYNITWYDYTMSTDEVALGGAYTLTVNFGGTIYDDWRLPKAVKYGGDAQCYGYNCIQGEMGHLYYTELGNIAYPSIGYGLTNAGDFQNLQRGPYWSSTPYDLYAGWFLYFDTNSGLQDGAHKYSSGLYSIAVRDGDVTVVPEPISSTLFIIGAGLLVGRRYLRRRQ